MIVTSLYAGLLAIVYIALTIYVVRGRRRYKVSIYDGGEKALAYRIRAHGNFAEYVPLTLLLIGMAESQNAPHPFVHALGIVLVAGRLLHAGSLLKFEKNGQPGGHFRFRMTGMVLTLAALGVAAIYLLGHAFGYQMMAPPDGTGSL